MTDKPELSTDDIEMSPIVAAQEEVETKSAPKAKKPKAEPVAEEGDGDGEQRLRGDVGLDEAGASSDDPASDGEPEKAEGEEEAKPKKRGKTAEQRIDELTKARRDAERRAEELEARLARLEAAKPAANDGPTAPDASDPKYEFGEADPNYIADLVQFKVDERLAKESANNDAKAQEAAAKAASDAKAAELNAKWSEKAAKAVEKYPDFQERVIDSAKAGDWELLPMSAAAVSAHENGADIASYLADNPNEAKKLADAERDCYAARDAALAAGLPPAMLQVLMGPAIRRAEEIFNAVEDKAKGQAAPKAKTVTDAPEPPKHQVRGTSGRFSEDFSSDNCDLSNMVKAIRG